MDNVPLAVELASASKAISSCLTTVRLLIWPIENNGASMVGLILSATRTDAPYTCVCNIVLRLRRVPDLRWQVIPQSICCVT
jgi:hypothetical protein